MNRKEIIRRLCYYISFDGVVSANIVSFDKIF